MRISHVVENLNRGGLERVVIDLASPATDALAEDAIRETARNFGYGEPLSVPLKVTPSVFPAELNEAQHALSSIGQYDVASSGHVPISRIEFLEEIILQDSNTPEMMDRLIFELKKYKLRQRFGRLYIHIYGDAAGTQRSSQTQKTNWRWQAKMTQIPKMTPTTLKKKQPKTTLPRHPAAANQALPVASLKSWAPRMLTKKTPTKATTR